MTFLDKVTDWIQTLLSVLPAKAQGFLWFPVLVIVVIVGVRLVVRHGLKWVGKIAAILLGWLIAAVGAALLLPDVLVASMFRLVRRRPPGLVYGYGDAVVGSVMSLTRLSGSTASGFARVARMNVAVIMVLSGLWLWGWNQSHCPYVARGSICVRPVTQWFETLAE